MIKFILTILLFCTNILYATTIVVDDTTEELEILSSSQIYIDTTKKLTIDDITSKDIKFQDNDKKLLSYGYSPDFDVWVKFTVKNNSDKAIHKILEYGNPLSTYVDLFDHSSDTVYSDGLGNINQNRKSINPIFSINLSPNESKIYYLKASSHITTLIIKLKIWKQPDFYNHELKHQAILFLFFGAMAILVIYNLFIYIFSRDISYLWYVLYILGVIVHQMMYTGVSYIYLLADTYISSIINLSVVIVAFPILMLGLFIKNFLQIRQYYILNRILTIYLCIFPFLILIFILTDEFNKYRNIFTVILLLYLVALTIYLSYKRNREAYFILFGWIVVSIAGILMYLSSIGVFNIYHYSPYIVEIAFITEAVIFAIALSDKINTLQKEKINANEELVVQKLTENERLELQVQEKTKDLKLSLEEKTLLLQELNHRVKNNMQMIVSLIRLQTNDIDDKKVQALFLTTQNRLNAMSELHELLYQKEDISYINAYEYFTTLIEGIQDTYTLNIDINYTIDTDLQTEQAVSCGIILNELVTNCLKYAFNDDTQKDKYIDIFLTKFEDKYTLIVKDNGVGYDQEKIKKSFGLILVTTLVESKLDGSIDMDTNYGVETTIIWREEDEEN